VPADGVEDGPWQCGSPLTVRRCCTHDARAERAGGPAAAAAAAAASAAEREQDGAAKLLPPGAQQVRSQSHDMLAGSAKVLGVEG